MGLRRRRVGLRRLPLEPRSRARGINSSRQAFARQRRSARLRSSDRSISRRSRRPDCRRRPSARRGRRSRSPAISRFPAPAKPGVYKLTISSESWIDVLEGDYLHPTAFTGATSCDGARKSVKFDLPARPPRNPVQRRQQDFRHRLAQPIVFVPSAAIRCETVAGAEAGKPSGSNRPLGAPRGLVRGRSEFDPERTFNIGLMNGR